MKPLVTLIHIIAFTALFVAYANVAAGEKPAGVRRALQTMASQVHMMDLPARKPVWQIGMEIGER